MRVCKNKNKTWTKSEIDYLLNSYGETTLEGLSKKLGRSEEAILAKYYSLTGEYSYILASGKLTVPMIVEALGVNKTTVNRWINRDGLPSTKYIGKRNSSHLIEYKDFWKWLEQNKCRIDFLKAKTKVLCSEPKWYHEEIKKAKLKGTNKRREWTIKEVQTAIFMKNNGYSYEEIGKHLNRTKLSVQRKLQSERINV